MIYTKYGASFGDERFVYLENNFASIWPGAFPFSSFAKFVHESLLNNEERDLIHKAWENRNSGI